jgi:RND family efflux transporter MFP subunit
MKNKYLGREEGRVRRLLTKIVPVAGMVLMLVVSLPGCKDRIKPGQTGVKRPEIKGVAVMRVVPSVVESVYETSGAVKAKATSTLASRVFGTVAATYVKEGDPVHSGDILLAIDDHDVLQRVQAAESGYNEALKAREAAKKQSDLADITSRRYGNLYKEKVVSGQEFDQIETQRNIANLDLERASLATGRAKALLEEARVHHGFTKIRAPFSGLVTSKKTEQGAMAVPGLPLITVEDTSRFKIEAYVDERLSEKIKKGTPISIRFDPTGGSVPAVITRIVPAIDPATRTFAIEAELKGPSLKSGLYGKVLIPDGKREATLVPRSAVVEKGQLTGVYAVDANGVINYRLIRTGKTFDGRVEALSGLNAGDRIVVGGIEKAVDGGLIRDQAITAEAR